MNAHGHIVEYLASCEREFGDLRLIYHIPIALKVESDDPLFGASYATPSPA